MTVAPVRVMTVKQTCSAYPSQWEGRTDDDCAIYVRYRSGRFCVALSDPGGNAMDACERGYFGSGWLIERQRGDELDGYMELWEVVAETAGLIDWSAALSD